MYRGLRDSRHIENAIPVGETLSRCKFEASDKTPCPIYFDTPVKMDPNVDYLIALKIYSKKKNSHSGSGGKTKVDMLDGTTFTFFTVQGGNNGTCYNRGQIPALLFSSGHHSVLSSQLNDSVGNFDIKESESHIHQQRSKDDDIDVVRRKLLNIRIAYLQRRWFKALRATMWRLMANTMPPKILQDPHNIQRLLGLTFRSERTADNETPTLACAITDLRVPKETLCRVAELATTALLGATISTNCTDAFVWCLKQSSKPLTYVCVCD